MALPQLDRLKSQLLTSGLQQKDNATWQVINQLIDILRNTNLEVVSLAETVDSGGTGGSGDGITQLTGDVTAIGPGVAVATIANDAVTTIKIADDAVTTDKIIDNAITTAKIADGAVTYSKIQDVSTGPVLLGSESGGTVEEIELGEDLAIIGGQLEVSIDGGVTPGIDHDLLSDTHPDTLPASPVLGDLIYAGEGTAFEGDYYDGAILGNSIEDFEGIRAAYMCGFNNLDLGPAGKVGCYAPPVLEFITPVLEHTWLSWGNINGYILSPSTDDFHGIRGTYQVFFEGETEHPSGYVGAYAAYPVDIIPTPTPEVPVSTAIWKRFSVGDTGEILTIDSDGFPDWSSSIDITGTITSDGDITTSSDVHAIGNFYEQGRPEYIDQFVDVPFNATDFTASGGTTPTWTVGADDYHCFRYSITGDRMTIQLFVGHTTVGGTAPTELRVKIPGGWSAIGTPAQMIGAQEAGAAIFDVYAVTEPSSDPLKIYIRKFPIPSGGTFDTTADGTYIGFTMDIRI